MTLHEAYQLLGINENSSHQNVIAAYRRLIKLEHGDRNNGNDGKSQKLNEAKSFVIQHLKSKTSLATIDSMAKTLVSFIESQQMLEKKRIEREERTQTSEYIYKQVSREWKSPYELQRNITAVLAFVSLVFALFSTNILPLFTENQSTIPNGWDIAEMINEVNPTLYDSIRDKNHTLNHTDSGTLHSILHRGVDTSKANQDKLAFYQSVADHNSRDSELIKTTFRKAYINNEGVRKTVDNYAALNVKPKEDARNRMVKIVILGLTFFLGLCSGVMQYQLSRIDSMIEKIKMDIDNKNRLKNFLRPIAVDIAKEGKFSEGQFISYLEDIKPMDEKTAIPVKELMLDARKVDVREFAKLILLKSQDKELIEEIAYKTYHEVTLYKILF